MTSSMATSGKWAALYRRIENTRHLNISPIPITRRQRWELFPLISRWKKRDAYGRLKCNDLNRHMRKLL